MSHQNQIPQRDLPAAPPEVVSGLVKRHTHDLRNFLNGLGMEVALLSETTDPAEKAAAAKRIRREMKCVETMLRSFTAKFVTEARISVCVSDVAEQWMSDARILLPERSITWSVENIGALLSVEAGLVRSVLGDLLLLIDRKFPGQPLHAGCCSEEGRVFFFLSGAPAKAETIHHDAFDELLWSLLQSCASQNGGTLERDSFGCRLVFAI